MWKKKCKWAVSVLCATLSFLNVSTFLASAAMNFNADYYAEMYPDVVAVYGVEYQALLRHYQEYGMKEGRLPYAGAEPGAEVSDIPAAVSENNTFPVPMNQLANLSSIQKKASNEELAQAYNVALEVVTPYADLSIEEQVFGIASSLYEQFNNDITYSMSAPHYNDPYGYFILHTASCAGSTRATGLCLNILGIPYEHVNENQYSHQWCRVNVNGTYWICDPFSPYCGPETAPYEYPF